jgi:hypothetical protein
MIQSASPDWIIKKIPLRVLSASVVNLVLKKGNIRSENHMKST